MEAMFETIKQQIDAVMAKKEFVIVAIDGPCTSGMTTLAAKLAEIYDCNVFHMDDVFQGENLYGVIQETQGLLEDGKIHIGDNDLLKMHFLNSAIKMNNDRGRGRLIKINPTSHIDGMASVLDAFTMRSKYFDEIGDQLKNGSI